MRGAGAEREKRGQVFLLGSFLYRLGAEVARIHHNFSSAMEDKNNKTQLRSDYVLTRRLLLTNISAHSGSG
jgi:hypothetical protein